MPTKRLLHVLAAGVMDPSTGLPASGGSVAFYEYGTTTPTTVYADEDGEQTLANPADLDAAGSLVAYTDVDLTIRVFNEEGETVLYMPSTTSGITTGQVALEQGEDTDGESFDVSTLDRAILLWVTSGGAGNWKYKRGAGTGVVSRYVKAKLGQLVDVRDFGAAGDASTADVAAIENALAAVASTGGSVLVPSGVYMIGSNIDLDSLTGVQIIGEGPGSILRASAANVAVIDMDACTGCAVRDIRIEGNGTAATAAGTGVAISGTCVDIVLDGVTISGPDSTHGNLIGVSVAGSDCRLVNVYVERVFGAASVGIKLDGSADAYVGAGTRIVGGASCDIGIGAKAAACTSAILDTVRVVGCISYGVYFYGGSLSEVRGGYISGTAGPGIVVDGGTDMRVQGVHVSGNTDGIMVRASSIGVPLRFNVQGNTVKSNSQVGIRVTTTTTSAPSAGTVGGNVVHSNTNEGILGISDDTLYEGNNLKDNGATYAALKISTANVSSAERGGTRNVVQGNTVRGTNIACLDITDSTGSGATNINTTIVGPNNFPPGAGVVHIRYAGANNQFGSGADTTANPRYIGYLGAGGVRPWMRIVATKTLLWDDLDKDILVNTTTGAVVLTLPDGGADSTTDEYNGATVRIFKVAGTELLTINASGTNNIYDYGTAAVVTGLKQYSALNTDQCIELTYYDGTWRVASRTTVDTAGTTGNFWITV